MPVCTWIVLKPSKDAAVPHADFRKWMDLWEASLKLWARIPIRMSAVASHNLRPPQVIEKKVIGRNFQLTERPNIRCRGCLQPACRKAASEARGKVSGRTESPSRHSCGVCKQPPSRDLLWSVGLLVLQSQTDGQQSRRKCSSNHLAILQLVRPCRQRKYFTSPEICVVHLSWP